jgi:multidrug efflux pump subunit AcrA (membrane-fusion protein)
MSTNRSAREISQFELKELAELGGHASAMIIRDGTWGSGEEPPAPVMEEEAFPMPPLGMDEAEQAKWEEKRAKWEEERAAAQAKREKELAAEQAKWEKEQDKKVEEQKRRREQARTEFKQALDERLAAAFAAGAEDAVRAEARRAITVRGYVLLGVVAAVVAMPLIAMLLRLDPQAFGAYIAPVTGITGTIVGYWFGSVGQVTTQPQDQKQG